MTTPAPRLDTAASVRTRFDALTSWLRSHAGFVLDRPFIHPTLPWETSHADLATACRGLSWEAVRTLETNPHAWNDAPSPFQSIAHDAAALCRVPQEDRPLQSIRPPRRVPERKWRQIEHLAHTVEPYFHAHHRVVDWCAGKGHLGRTLGARLPAPVLTLERQEALCRDAQQLAERDGVELVATHADVLGELPPLTSDDQVVGLHACGRLTDRLLDVSAAAQARVAAVASCCYHATADGEFHPQSQRAARVPVPIDRHALRLVTADEVVARPAIRRRREREHAFRLGLDLLVREATGEDRYHPLPSVTPALIDGTFEDFCRQLTAPHGLPLPPTFSPDLAEAAGWERSRIARAFGLVRALFRRPLEVWLVLDRAQACLERDRHVRLVEFCDRSLTPRNLLLLSSRAPLESM